MPSRWQVDLTGPRGVEVPIAAPHAVVSGWLDGYLGDARGHRAAVKPYSVTPPMVRGEHTVLEIRLLDDVLGQHLRQRLPVGSSVRLGGPGNMFRVARQPRQIGSVGWPELLAWSGERSWDLELLTPATVRHRNRTSPFLAPRAVMTGLLARFPVGRWRSGPPADPAKLSSSVWVSDVEGQTVVTERAGQIVSGFLGRISYRCDGTDSEAAAVHALLGSALYCGIGSHTAWGFGVTQISARTRRREPA